MTHEEDNTLINPFTKKRIFSYLGLAMKSSNLVSGEFATEKAIQSREALLVLIAEDASDNTKKKFANKCDYYGVPIYFFGTKEELGKAIGKGMRTSIGLLEHGLANGIVKQLGN